MKPELVPKLTTSVMYEYMNIVRDYFWGIKDIDEFIEAFNYAISSYQGSPKKLKMDPFNIRNQRAVSCSTAAALAGMWSLLENVAKPSYYLERATDSLNSEPKSTSHCKVRLSQNLDKSESYLHLKQDNSQYSRGKYVLKRGRPADELTYKFVGQTGKFVANRISVMGLSRETISILLPNGILKSELKQVATDESTFINYLIAQYVGAKAQT